MSVLRLGDNTDEAVRSIDGAETLARMVRHAAGRVEIMAGGGVRVEDIPALLAAGVDAVHLLARCRADDGTSGGPGGGGDAGYDVTDAETVVAASAALR